MTTFEDIKIVGLDVDLTQPSRKAPGLRLMHLRLSESPPPEWVQLFQQERRFPRHTMWRHASVEGGHIVVDCVPEELEQHHLKDLKRDVANSNDKYRQWLERRDAADAQQRDAGQKERERLERLRSKLDFD